MARPPSVRLRWLLPSLASLGVGMAASPALALDTQLVESGLSSPVFLTAPDGDSRLFVVEKEGRIKVRSGGMWSTFLDISGQVDAENERGLLGLAFDPNYRTNHTFYVDYIDKTTKNTQIARFTASGDVASKTGTPILNIVQPPDLTNHKGGWIGFRPGEPNNLYIATGDGGGRDDLRPDPNFDNNAQNTNRLLGKILRIDVHPADPTKGYANPESNPFFHGGGAPEVWDYGLRNPYRDSFDRKTHDLIIADVGQDAREELDFETASSAGGNNYGWRSREGTIATPTGGVGKDPKPPGFVDPVYDYLHGNGPFDGEAVIGGYVYRGSFLKGVQGEYFFADYVSGRIWSMETDPTGALLPGTVRDRTAELKRLNQFDSISSFGEDGFSNLYIVDLSGKVLQIVPEPSTYAMILFALMPMAWRLMRRPG